MCRGIHLRNIMYNLIEIFLVLFVFTSPIIVSEWSYSMRRKRMLAASASQYDRQGEALRDADVKQLPDHHAQA